MNCKFHPTVEAVTTCDVCGTEICSICAKDAFYENDGKSVCLECSLEEAEEELVAGKLYHKSLWINGIIASVVWIIGVFVFTMSSVQFIGLLIMLGAVVFFYAKVMDIKTLFTSQERTLVGKIEEILFTIVLDLILLPFIFILLLIRDKWHMIKDKAKAKKIKTALGNANR